MRILRGLLGSAAEIGVAVCMLAGWLALSAGVASLLGRHVWPFAVAALCFSLAGWELVILVVRRGIYVLTREPKASP